MESTVATLIVIYVACMIVWAIRMVRKRREVFRQVRFRLGFMELSSPDDSLLHRIIPIVQYRKEKVSVDKIYKRDEGSCILYDCHIHRSGQKDNDSRNCVLVIPGVDLPAFRLAPCLVKSGMFSGLVKKATQMVLKQGGFTRVDTNLTPDFGAKYILTAKDPDEVRKEIPSHIWHDLMSLSEHLFVRGQGDTIIFSVVDVAALRKKSGFEAQEEYRLGQAVSVASNLGRIFRSIERQTSYATWR